MNVFSSSRALSHEYMGGRPAKGEWASLYPPPPGGYVPEPTPWACLAEPGLGHRHGGLRGGGGRGWGGGGVSEQWGTAVGEEVDVQRAHPSGAMGDTLSHLDRNG